MKPLFPDRFDPEAYSNDETFTIGVVHRYDLVLLSSVSIPQRLMLRCQKIADAYSLHLTGSISMEGVVRFDAYQCKTVEAEILFVLGLVDDPLLQAHGRRLLAVVQKCAYHPQRICDLLVAPPHFGLHNTPLEY